ncbi:MAG: hypothetical protein U5K73_02505 [Halofilum sp. (in: g-proteobacteria)]|nr:hypothetical protein [Halofilum sp. (in: g-proteobacteria)]
MWSTVVSPGSPPSFAGLRAKSRSVEAAVRISASNTLRWWRQASPRSPAGSVKVTMKSSTGSPLRYGMQVLLTPRPAARSLLWARRGRSLSWAVVA